MGLTYNANLHTIKRFDAGNQNNTFWLNGQLKFVNASLSEVLTTLENCYQVSFSVPVKIKSFSKFNAEFKNNNLQQVLDVLKITYPITIAEKNNRFIVTNK